MAEHPRIYDLVLVLTATVEEDARTALIAEVENAITSAGGEILRQDDWGLRPLTFKIAHQREGHYYLRQFTGPTSVLETLEHNLHIADDVLRFRIIKVTPGTPEAPSSPPPVIAGVAADGRGGIPEA